MSTTLDEVALKIWGSDYKNNPQYKSLTANPARDPKMIIADLEDRLKAIESRRTETTPYLVSHRNGW